MSRLLIGWGVGVAFGLVVTVVGLAQPPAGKGAGQPGARGAAQDAIPSLERHTSKSPR